MQPHFDSYVVSRLDEQQWMNCCRDTWNETADTSSADSCWPAVAQPSVDCLYLSKPDIPVELIASSHLG